MKKSLFYGILLIVIAAFVLLSGCISIPGLDSNSPSENETENISEIYNLSIFYPIINGQEKKVESGTYYAAPKASDIQVIRLVNNKKEIQILKEDGLLVFTDAEIKDVYFIPAEIFTMTKEDIEALINNPAPSDLNYKINVSSNESHIVLAENFTGIMAYTFIPSSNDSILINDNPEAVKIVLPSGTTTGNRLIGTARPTPDLIESGENGEKILKWNAPVGKIRVKYYAENIPYYMLLAASALIGAMIAVYLWYRYQIKKLQKISKYVDPNENDGFSEQKKV